MNKNPNTVRFAKSQIKSLSALKRSPAQPLAQPYGSRFKALKTQSVAMFDHFLSSIHPNPILTTKKYQHQYLGKVNFCLVSTLARNLGLAVGPCR